MLEKAKEEGAKPEFIKSVIDKIKSLQKEYDAISPTISPVSPPDIPPISPVSPPVSPPEEEGDDEDAES
jgi:hypothetical protein